MPAIFQCDRARRSSRPPARDARLVQGVNGKGLILAAPKSGSGKTLITAGLLRHLRERGIRVAAAKAGPDYIDPTFHTLASGAPCVNLDPWAMRPATLAGLLGELGAVADIIVCEGVMGLFDGAGPDGEAGSTAELARVTAWPVVLVVDAGGQGASVAALVAGFARHDPQVPLAGVILNRVTSLRHRTLLTGAIARHLPGLPVLGAMPSNPALKLPSRHLGLVPAGELAEHEELGAAHPDRLLRRARRDAQRAHDPPHGVHRRDHVRVLARRIAPLALPAAQARSCRAMTSRWIWLVPS